MVNGSRNTVIYIYSLLELFNSIIPKPYSAKTHKGILQRRKKKNLDCELQSIAVLTVV